MGGLISIDCDSRRINLWLSETKGILSPFSAHKQKLTLLLRAFSRKKQFKILQKSYTTQRCISLRSKYRLNSLASTSIKPKVVARNPVPRADQRAFSRSTLALSTAGFAAIIAAGVRKSDRDAAVRNRLPGQPAPPCDATAPAKDRTPRGCSAQVLPRGLADAH